MPSCHWFLLCSALGLADALTPWCSMYAHVWRSQNRATQPNINDSRWNSCLSLNAVVLIELQMQSNKRWLLICSQWNVYHACSWFAFSTCHFPVNVVMELFVAKTTRRRSHWSNWWTPQVGGLLICSEVGIIIMVHNYTCIFCCSSHIWVWVALQY